ncbi:MAG: hypothetical protein JNL21_37080 [Myxococcales bacterium]|nr:hypothetical protein [Myxococcales bacterium]
MSQDDDDLGGGTLVIAPEDRPDAQQRGGSAPAARSPAFPSPSNRTSNIDDSWDDDASDAPGTFIMNVEHHAAPPNPASPFAEASKQSGAWPQAPAPEHVVIGSPSPADPNLAVATTLMGMTNLSSEVEAAIAARNAAEDAPGHPPFGGPPAHAVAPYEPAPYEPAPAHAVAPYGPAPYEPTPYEPQPPPVGGLPSYPQPDAGPAFPRPGSYPTGESSPAGSQRSGAASLLLGALVGLTTVTVVVGGYYAYRAFKAPSATDAALASAAASSSSQPKAPTSSSGSSPTPSAPPAAPSAPPAPSAPATGAEAEAKAALEKFGAGLAKCVAETIHVLPGTSPAVPSSLAWLKNGTYQPGIRDFDSSVYACSRFKMTTPMTFLFQWQSDDVAGKKGSAVVWIDDDRDGKADRAFAFEAKLAKRNVAEIGPIVAVDPSRKIKKR